MSELVPTGRGGVKSEFTILLNFKKQSGLWSCSTLMNVLNETEVCRIYMFLRSDFCFFTAFSFMSLHDYFGKGAKNTHGSCIIFQLKILCTRITRRFHVGPYFVITESSPPILIGCYSKRETGNTHGTPKHLFCETIYCLFHETAFSETMFPVLSNAHGL